MVQNENSKKKSTETVYKSSKKHKILLTHYRLINKLFENYSCEFNSYL